MATPTPFSCRCGTLKGHMVDLTPKTGTRLVCHCADCVRASRHFGLEVDTDTGVDLVQTTADQVVIEAGAEHLALAKLSPRGLFRWYARCCGTPMFNTLSGPGTAFAAILTERLSDTDHVGPVYAHVNRTGPDGKSRSEHILPIVGAILSRGLRARVSGRWRQTPFFDTSTGQPVVAAELLPKDAGRT